MSSTHQADRAEILRLFGTIRVWKGGGKSALDKPLLILYALGKWAQSREGIYFEDDREEMQNLFRRFTSGGKGRPYHPFWRLQSDGVWEIPEKKKVRVNRSGDALIGDLRRHNILGQFSKPVRDALEADDTLVLGIAQQTLEKSFSDTLHDDILKAVGLWALSGSSLPHGRRRDPKFREQVLVAYEWHCAVCQLNLRLEDRGIALDAAHIQWHQAQGPDIVPNGLALCVLHHKIFDQGAFTISNEDGRRIILISDQLGGDPSSRETLLRFHCEPVRPPQRPEDVSAPQYLDWHCKQVFRGKPRPRI